MAENKKPRVLFVNAFIFLPGEGGYKRTLYLFDMMKKMGYRPNLITSDFNHYAKKVRDISKFRKEFPDYNDILFLHMPPYKKNISFKRYLCERYWVRLFKQWFNDHAKDYDVVYYNMPAMDSILSTEKICKANGIKMIIDVRDLRPESLRIVLKNEFIYKILTYPMKVKADKAYACADEMIAVSKEYLERGMRVNKKSQHPTAVYIGSILEKFYLGIDKYSCDIEKKDGEIWVTYAGTLGDSYDLYTLLDVAKQIQIDNKYNVIFKILGQGPARQNLEEYANSKGLKNVDFVGFVDYELMAAYLSKSDMTINSVKRRASQSIINKVADYFAAGIPCLNGSVCKEMRDLIDDYQLGINYEPENVESLLNSIYHLIEDQSFSKQCGVNAKKIAAEKFDRKKSYLEIIKRIDEIVN